MSKIVSIVSHEPFAMRIGRSVVVNNARFGWIAEFCRTLVKDKVLEEELRATGLGDAGIANWLTSSDGRHLSDVIEDVPDNDEPKLRGKIREYVKDAFINVTVWNHPDHNGSLSGSSKLKQTIYEAFVLEHERRLHR